VELRDIVAMLLKASGFGFIIFMMATTIGINTSGGSREVGLATTRAVVWSFVLMAIMDYVLTFLIYGTK
jgi:phospholipid/cholesterol/gamma-HCH transport system permease protein